MSSVGVGDSPLRVSVLEQLVAHLPATGDARIEAVAALQGLRALLRCAGDVEQAQGKDNQ